MGFIPIKYNILLLFLTICAPTMLNAQVDRIDTIATVKRLQAASETSVVAKDYINAVKYLHDANLLLSSSKDSILSAEVILSSAELSYYLQNFTRSAEKVASAISILSNTDQEPLLASAYLLNGLILTRLNKYDSAEAFLIEAEKLFEDLDSESGVAKVTLGKGVLELKKENYFSAINYFDNSLIVFYNNNNSFEQAFAEIHKADALVSIPEFNKKRITEAKMSLRRAESIIKSKGYDYLALEIYRVEAEILLKEKKIVAAQKSFSNYLTKKDSMNQVFLAVISTESESYSNIGDLNRIILQQRDDITKAKKSIFFNQATTFLGFALIIILSLFIILLYKNNVLRKKANNLLKDKNTELIIAKEKVEKASIAKEQFLSTITHELRTPLYAVTGLTHLLMEEDFKPSQKQHLESLKFSGDYLLSLINNILDVNKLEAKKVELDATVFNLKKRISDVLVALKKSADDKKNVVHFQFDESIPMQVSGDALRLSQILINLIGNSAKFTENGNIWVRVKRLSSTAKQMILQFEVQDDGVGISKKKQEVIFENFSQGSVKINRIFGGTGLGLAIVKNLLELMNSKINLESKLGEGSRFWFNLTMQIPDDAKTVQQPVSVTKISEIKKRDNLKVLVVDDNQINQMITRKILSKENIQSVVANNGLDAVELVKAGSFDIVLMDIHMPGISGVEATKIIRKFNKNIPILALTAVTLDDYIDEFYEAGFTDIIPKPFAPEEFFQKIYSAALIT